MRLDRLSALIASFELSVVTCPRETANLLLFEASDTALPVRLVFSPSKPSHQADQPGETLSFAAKADWGGASNPLLSALPDTIDLPLTDDPEMQPLAQLLTVEHRNRRCGAETVLSRLGEVLMVRLLRNQLERGMTSAGLLGGLADPRLSRAIIAVHEDPGKAWRNSDLAGIAGLSVSRFVELFGSTVGETPMSYVRRWRMVLARQDVERGERIQTVARRYGYASGEALGRAFRREHHIHPTALRRTTHASVPPT
jgi:AraC-like DNA-binding protein